MPTSPSLDVEDGSRGPGKFCSGMCSTGTPCRWLYGPWRRLLRLRELRLQLRLRGLLLLLRELRLLWLLRRRRRGRIQPLGR